MKPKTERELLEIIDDTLWMAIRYAHGRQTYAPRMVRDACRVLKDKYGYVPQEDKTIHPPDTDNMTGLRSDYLDDLV